ncbi:beta-ribofuranosylaminobenzene 5'-phosphate synthase [Methanothermobacter tenebrarum]|uniref:Beta-ribofuranosylaminobenzene 5'-phosphate synthase n=1 Tax=Methanothermobacter tenebrarum TaxID=680118 RepID=A0A328PDX7_9EURY|nr:beta-ribofuranosylaminobenzene 5'-phosphate synthase [Methanothermobacter tenebrarum]NPV64893.1 hypothetical protein [Methanobacteriaceae archaeon]RAO79411.1 hypothetical protein DPC56_03650 [Methanothermobacter tenebrarum]
MNGRIITSSRLHLTLIDLNGERGRLDGGVGITLKNPNLIIKAKPNGEFKTEFEEKNLEENLIREYSAKIEEAAKRTLSYLKSIERFDFIIEKTFPAHSGLGSGTQVSLAIAKLITGFHGTEMDSWELARIVGRGGTSGIGVASFEYGGFIVDGGHSKKEKTDFLPSSASRASPPPVIARYDFPEDWNIIVAVPRIDRQVSGRKEVNIFQEYCPIPLEEVERLSHIILMKMMPSVLEEDIESFGEAINEIQRIGFKRVERKLQHPIIDKIIDNMLSTGAVGAGMSSFGPAVYGITDTNPKDVLKAAKEAMGDVGGLALITNARNSGAKYE